MLPKGGRRMNKKIAAGVAATVAAASIATNMLVEPEELVHSAEYLAARTQAVAVEPEGDYDITVEEEAEKTRADAVRAWIIRLPVVVKAVFLLPLWALGAIPVTIGTAVFTAMAPIWAQICGALLQIALLIGAFCLGYKLVFPKKKVRDLFKKRNFKWLFLGAGTVTMANFVLTTAWTGWPVLRAAIMTVVGFGALCLLWHRIAGKIKPDEPNVVTTRLRLEY